jgi:hypothetical protein
MLGLDIIPGAGGDAGLFKKASQLSFPTPIGNPEMSLLCGLIAWIYPLQYLFERTAK